MFEITNPDRLKTGVILTPQNIQKYKELVSDLEGKIEKAKKTYIGPKTLMPIIQKLALQNSFTMQDMRTIGKCRIKEGSNGWILNVASTDKKFEKWIKTLHKNPAFIQVLLANKHPLIPRMTVIEKIDGVDIPTIKLEDATKNTCCHRECFWLYWCN